ncbi:MAG: type II toxin-antitoxin system VapC family toxin [Pseudomonadota bacterium]|nr:type II toxin-antitoxin system VapC family toxin [Pseudomonadota bacterium]
MYLLDTNVISELRRQKPHGAVVAWIEAAEDKDLYVSAVTLGEIQAGIEITREQDPDKALQIEQWLNLVGMTYNVLAMDGEVFRAWARLMHRTSETLYEDAMIAATAQVNKLTVVTRNITDFQNLGVKLLNQFDTNTD